MRRPRKFPSYIVIVTFVVAAIAAACAKSATPDLSSLPVNSADVRISLLLDQVKIVDYRPDMPGYNRDWFGQAWTDDHAGTGGHNGCDTRNDVLARQLTDVVFRPGSRQCVVVSGALRDPYTGHLIEFRKANASAVQIDHIMPLAYAWDMGANKWTRQRRINFANEQANLLAVDGPTNMSKGDKTPGVWLPLNEAYRCTYVRKFLEVAIGNDLPITRDDAYSISLTSRRCS